MYRINPIAYLWEKKLLEEYACCDIFSKIGEPEDPEEKRIKDIERKSRKMWSDVDELLSFEPYMTRDDDKECDCHG